MAALVSVIMSVYNETETELALAIESILNQTYKDIEFIIVLDAPDNELVLKLIKKYQTSDDRIKIIINNQNQGLAKSLNTGIKSSSGEYIARMDADDISFKNRLDVQISFLEKNADYDIVSTNRVDI